MTARAHLSERQPRVTEPASVLFLRVDEAADILRIGRSAAYELAHQWIATSGARGIPAIKVGRMIRIPKAAFERWASLGDDDDDIALRERI
jgi:excisionase family DNA binding protein